MLPGGQSAETPVLVSGLDSFDFLPTPEAHTVLALSCTLGAGQTRLRCEWKRCTRAVAQSSRSHVDIHRDCSTAWSSSSSTRERSGMSKRWSQNGTALFSFLWTGSKSEWGLTCWTVTPWVLLGRGLSRRTPGTAPYGWEWTRIRETHWKESSRTRGYH